MGPHEPTPTPGPDEIQYALQAYPPEIVEAAAKVWPQLPGTVMEVAALISINWQVIADALHWGRLAVEWAETAHPEWVKILNRTKKRRTRKKYLTRILRAYEEETA